MTPLTTIILGGDAPFNCDVALQVLPSFDKHCNKKLLNIQTISNRYALYASFYFDVMDLPKFITELQRIQKLLPLL
jgi:hypothetical protein